MSKAYTILHLIKSVIYDGAEYICDFIKGREKNSHLSLLFKCLPTGELDHKTASISRPLTFSQDIAAVQLYKLPGYRQAQAGSLSFINDTILNLVKFFKYAVQMIRINTDASVFDNDLKDIRWGV